MPARICAVSALIALCLWAHARPPHPAPRAGELMRAQKHQEAIVEFERCLETNRFDGSIWSGYAYALHMVGRMDESITAGQRAIELGFNPPGEMYNIACAHAVGGRTDDAIEWLRKAFEHRFADQETLEGDTELDSLRADPRFIELTGLNPPQESDPARRWAWDLDFLARRMEQMHWSLYANVPKEAFLNEIASIKQAAASGVSEPRLRARISRLLAMVGDGHTTLSAFAEGESSIDRVPLSLRWFSDGIHVIGTPEDLKELLGARVLKVGPLTIEDAARRLRAYCSVDNEMGYLYAVPPRLVSPPMLQEIGAVTGGDAQVEYTLRLRTGEDRAVRLAPRPITRDEARLTSIFRPGYTHANADAERPAPLYQRDLQTPLTFQWIPEASAVYFGFHAVSGNPDQPFDRFVESLFHAVEDNNAERLIIDMRLNGGGNTGLVQPLLSAIVANKRINRHAHLYVIIGRNTFSAAQNTVNLLESFTNATFVGEPTGSRPAFVGESTSILLPYSRLRVYCSSRYWQILSSTDEREWVPPQIAAEFSFSDFAENRDPCMDAILAHIAAQPSAEPTSGQ